MADLKIALTPVLGGTGPFFETFKTMNLHNKLTQIRLCIGTDTSIAVAK